MVLRRKGVKNYVHWYTVAHGVFFCEPSMGTLRLIVGRSLEGLSPVSDSFKDTIPDNSGHSSSFYPMAQ